jgi:hypothetical protein
MAHSLVCNLWVIDEQTGKQMKRTAFEPNSKPF